MGLVGRFCDRLCAEHPTLARAVLEKPLAPLHEWIDWDKDGNPCGCLIGTAALAAGFRPRMDCQVDDDNHDAVNFLDHAFHHDERWDIERVGMRVAFISCRFARDYAFGTAASAARTIHLLRTRIARQLAIRESALPLGAVLPGEPVETELASSGGR